MNLFLDDERRPRHVIVEKLVETHNFHLYKNRNDWKIVRNFDDFCKAIAEEIPTLISFDHDLGYGNSGYDCAKFLVDFCAKNDKKLPEFLVHSANPIGRQNIISYLQNAKKVLAI